MAKQEMSAKDFREDLLRVLADKTGLKANKPVKHGDVYDSVATLKGVTRDQYGQQANTNILWVDRWIQWAFKSLVDEGLGKRAGRGQWALTPQGVKEASGLVAGTADATANTDTDADEQDTPAPTKPVEAVSLSVGPGQDENSYHTDPYIRALAAQDTSCFEAYSDKSTTCSACPLAGACMNAMAAELSTLARELAEEDREAEARAKMGISDPKPKKDKDQGAKSSGGGSKTKVSQSNANLIVVQQQAICRGCGKTIPKGDEGWWVRSTNTSEGGLYHADCLEVE